MKQQVVDYLLMEETISKKFLNFKILPNIDYIHSPITATLKCHTKHKTKNRKFINPPKAYKWDNQGS